MRILTAKLLGGARSDLKELYADADGNLLVNPGALNSLIDSVDLARTTKGMPTVTHNGLTSPSLSALVDTTGYNGVLVQARVTAFTSGTVNFWVQGAMDGVNFYSCYAHSGGASAYMNIALTLADSRIQVFRGIPDSIKISVWGTFVATYSCMVQPIVL